jgi:hypothetical protein
LDSKVDRDIVEEEKNNDTVDSAAGNDMEVDASWEEYDSAKFGPDVMAMSTSASATAGPSKIAAVSTALSATNKEYQHATPVDDTVFYNLLSSSQSFSDLNLYREDPYSANAEFDFSI